MPAVEPGVPSEGERVEVLFEHSVARVERIVSSAHVDDVVYDQDHDEWVLLLAGEAALDVEGDTVELRAGDHVWLPAHCRHRVVRTEAGTVWLAVHIGG